MKIIETCQTKKLITLYKHPKIPRNLEKPKKNITVEHKNVLACRSILPTIFRVDLNNDATRSCNNNDQALITLCGNALSTRHKDQD